MSRFKAMTSLLVNAWVGLCMLTIIASCSASYSFTGGDVGQAKTLSVTTMINESDLVNPQLAQLLTTTLQDVMARQTPLDLIVRDGDLQVSGRIIAYDVRSDAPGANDQVAQSRLSVSVAIDFINLLDDTKNFKQSFNVYRNFPASQTLSQVEDVLVDEIVMELCEKVFNRALVQW